ncbi:MAG: tyrosine--tRNA ligase [candidate division WOR-3 bacterium]|jgi:tyrosyl-tRNA synthetase|nr:tyrosine--tRNA ligase [candidate division WOR-3 bacterium]MCR4423646.1 tyrosine--tRNA ligase [candidate division WOR-3 bacterium]MDH7518985.1 tyrosine--tRNA ligase [bacterium]
MVQAEIEQLKRGIDRLETEAELIELLQQSRARGKPLRIKLGIDASGPDIHLGFAVVLRKLRQFQDLGHIAVLIIGDFTGKIGDPTGRSKTRPQLTDEQIKENMARYREQVFKILDPNRCEFRYNSEWLDALNASEIVNIAARYTVARLIEREDFKNRLQQGVPLFVHELLYPLFQGYDSVMVQADVELGGADQYWNLLVGRELQARFGQKPQVIMTLPLLVGTDGKMKMSKSYGNYVGITEPPQEMFGKLMSIPDELILDYFRLTTTKTEAEINQIARRLQAGENPRHIKAELAKEVVALYHSPAAAQIAAEEFDRVFKEKQAPSEIPEYVLPPEGINIVELISLTGLLPSKSEARRKLQEGAVYLDGQRVADPNYLVKNTGNPMILKVGKRRFLRLISRNP